MKRAKTLAMICYGLVAVASLAVGVHYLLADQIMSYHLQAMNTTWEMMTAGQRIMTLSFMRAGGLGFLISGLALAILLAVPFRRGESWSRWALAAIATVDTALMTANIFNLQMNSLANPPLAPTAFALALSLAGFAFSLGVKPTTEVYDAGDI